MIKTTVYLPEELKERITAEARRREISEAELIRAAIDHEVPPPPTRGPRFGFIEDTLNDGFSAANIDEYLSKHGFGAAGIDDRD